MNWWKGRRGEWYVVIQIILFILVGLGPILPPHRSLPWPTIGLIIGSLLLLLGIGLSGAGLLNLGDNLTPLPHPKKNSTLVETGAYRLVRHPIYSGLIFGAFGWALIWASGATLLYAFVLFFFFDLKTRREEKWLQDKFPTYPKYQRRVRKLIPFLY